VCSFDLSGFSSFVSVPIGRLTVVPCLWCVLSLCSVVVGCVVLGLLERM